MKWSLSLNLLPHNPQRACDTIEQIVSSPFINNRGGLLLHGEVEAQLL